MGARNTKRTMLSVEFTFSYGRSNPVLTTSISTKSRLQRQIFCGINYFLTTNHYIILLWWNNVRL